MRLLIQEYGRLFECVITGVFIVSLLAGGFLVLWHENGGADDSIKTNFKTNEAKRTPPVLRVKDLKIRCGETVDWGNYVSAEDYDGSGLVQEIRVEKVEECTEKNTVEPDSETLMAWSGKVWGKFGIYKIFLSVQSPVTGKVTKGKLLLLVDGRKK